MKVGLGFLLCADDSPADGPGPDGAAGVSFAPEWFAIFEGVRIAGKKKNRDEPGMKITRSL